MKRFLIAALVLGLFSVSTLVGCSEETKETTKQTIDTPGGSKTIEDTKKIEATGDQKGSTGDAGKPVEAPK